MTQTYTRPNSQQAFFAQFDPKSSFDSGSGSSGGNLNHRNRVEVIDRDGWRKEYPLTRSILHIGSDSRNDIVLEGGRGMGVDARHAQLIAIPGSRSYRLVNLGQSPIYLTSRGGESLMPRGSVELFDADVIHIGEHTFRFFAGGHLSNAIGLSLHLPNRYLSMETMIEGVVTVQNMGDVPGVQFKLTLEGLTPEWYELGPGPILFPGAQKRVMLHIRHAQIPSVSAGKRTVTIQATASEAYPGESATASQTIEIAPFFQHEIRFLALD